MAVREFALEKPYGRVDYLLFVGGKPVGVIEAKSGRTTLKEVEGQSTRYASGLPSWLQPTMSSLPFIYEFMGSETRFTNVCDPEARSRRVFTFHRPETLTEWARQITENPEMPTFRARLKAMPPLDKEGLRGNQIEAIRETEKSLAEGRPRALIQMATGSGKTFTAAELCISADQVRRGQARLVPGGPLESGRARGAGVRQRSRSPRPNRSSPPSTASST